MSRKVALTGYYGKDAVRHVIKSHATMLVSLPTEVKLRAGLGKGVDVRVDQDPENPLVIILEVLNPIDYSEELAAHLGKSDVKKKTAKKKRSKKKKSDEYDRLLAERNAGLTTSEQEIVADAVKYGVDTSERYYPPGWRKGDPHIEGHPMHEDPEESD